jgi:uncharacterized membrane protein (UPF0127 family)
MEKFAKSADPVQQALRDRKKGWNTASKEFMKRIKGLRNGLNGRGDSNYGLPPSNIKDPLPAEIGSFLSQLSSDFQFLVSESEKIANEQAYYSKNRRKPTPKTQLEGAVAALQPNLVKTAMAKEIGKIKISNLEMETIIAESDEDQMAGLMYVPPPTPVMSFVYSSPRINRFWMKNTPAPLDIVFALKGTIVAIHEGEPFSTKLIGDFKPSDLVVELPYGSCEKLGIQIGDPVELIK